MTRIAELLGPAYDAPAKLPTRLGTDAYEEKRHRALAALRHAEASNDADSERLLLWELGLIDLKLGVEEGVLPYGGSSFELYAAHFRLTDETTKYCPEQERRECAANRLRHHGVSVE